MSPIEEKIYTNLNEIGVEFLIRESFLGYKYRKQNGKLYAADSEVPTKLIAAYYGLTFDEKKFDSMKKAFISKYIRNESELEGLDVNNAHDKTEVEGLALMYEYIHSPKIDENFSVYTLLNLHIKLFSLTPNPSCGGTTRTCAAYLPGTSAELCPWEFIGSELKKLDVEVQTLVEIAKHLKGASDITQLFNYIDRCIELKCKLIKVHPFYDGNGRSVRCFINKLFEDAGLPPVYIKPNEREEYLKAMDMMSHNGDYSYIKNFYRYKICDSIIELDINNKINDTQNVMENRQKNKIIVKKKEQQ